MARITITDEMVQAFFEGASTDPGETINARETRYGLAAVVPLIEAQIDQGTPDDDQARPGDKVEVQWNAVDRVSQRTNALHTAAMLHNLRFIQSGSFDEPEADQ